MRPLREFLGIPLTAGAVLLFCAEHWTAHPQIDDAYISYRYARNLVEGFGLTYNPGEYVEGFTNLLWVLLVAAGHAIGFEARSVGHALGLASGAAALIAAHAYARAGLAPSRAWIAALPPWIVLASLGFARWSTSGLETGLFAAAATAALAAQARKRLGWATGFAALATLTRPEGVLVASAVLGFHVLSQRREGRSAWKAPAAYAAFLVLLTGFRLVYYGAPVPNTFYAKVGGVPLAWGIAYLKDFLWDGAGLLLIPAAFAVLRDRRWGPGAAFCGVTAAYVVWIGGDAFAHSRFLVPILPCLAVLGTRGALAAYDTRRGLGLLAFALLPAAVWWQVFGGLPGALPDSKRVRGLQEARRDDGWFERGAARRAQILQERGEASPLIATGAIGALGYHTRAPLIDILGIVDPEVARSHPAPAHRGAMRPGHQRSNADYVFARSPDYILIRKRGSPGGALPAALEIWDHPDLARHYAWDDEMGGYRRATPRPPAGPASGAAPLPNVLLIVIDTLRADRLGSYGSPRGLTPFLDSLAERAYVFRNAYAQSSWTAPSVASLMTSRFPSQHGVNSFSSAVPEEEVTLAEALRERGYATGGFSAHPMIAASRGYSQGFDRYDAFWPVRAAGEEWNVRGDAVNRHALAWLDALKESGGLRSPVFLYLHYMEPHPPYDPPEHVLHSVAPGRDLADVRAVNRSFAAGLEGDLLRSAQDFYDAQVMVLDVRLRELFSALEERGFLERAVVAITADHGEEFRDHGGIGHGLTLYNELIRVPLLVLVPDGSERVDVEATLGLVDVAPLLLGVIGARPAPSWMGSAPPGMPGSPPPGSAHAGIAYSELLGSNRPLRDRQHAEALVSDGTKLLVGADGRREFYALDADPGERAPAVPDAARRDELVRLLERLRERARSGASPGQVRELDARSRDALRALGYAE